MEFHKYIYHDAYIERNDEFVYIPVEEIPDCDYEIIELNMRFRDKKRNFKEIAEVPVEILKKIPRAFDIVGKIAVIKLSNDLKKYEREIGDAMLKSLTGIKTVASDYGVKGKYRIRDLRVIAGEKNLITCHTEYGIKIWMDLSLMYFSPRLAYERHLTAEDVKNGERILDMFSGVGSFSLHIAKKKPDVEIISMDANISAVKYIKKNIAVNKIYNMHPIVADAENLPFKKKFDRIIMNLPHTSLHFLKSAINLMDNGFIHLHIIWNKEKLHNLKKKINEKSQRTVEIKRIRKVHEYSPSEAHFSVLLGVKS